MNTLRSSFEKLSVVICFYLDWLERSKIDMLFQGLWHYRNFICPADYINVVILYIIIPTNLVTN